MTIHLPKDLERFVQEAVRAGRYAHEDDVIRDALTRLRQAMPGKAAPAKRSVKRTKAALPKKKPLPIEEIHRQMLASGLITSLPDPALDLDDDDPDDAPVTIKGEPLSETIIRERR
jgi:putative addiction module CopG family antidote